MSHCSPGSASIVYVTGRNDLHEGVPRALAHQAKPRLEPTCMIDLNQPLRTVTTAPAQNLASTVFDSRSITWDPSNSKQFKNLVLTPLRQGIVPSHGPLRR